MTIIKNYSPPSYSHDENLILLMNKDYDVNKLKKHYAGNFTQRNFIASTVYDKHSYVAKLLEMQLMRTLSKEDVDVFLSNFFDLECLNRNVRISSENLLVFPLDLNGVINEQFIKEFIVFLEQDNTVIVGGNKHRDESLELLEQSSVFTVHYPKKYEQDWISRKDKINNFWTLYNKKTGSKVSFFLNSSLDAQKKLEFSIPDSVDFKITNCEIDDDIDYQNNDFKKKFLNINIIERIADDLKSREVFECVIVGGEPTYHPDFIKILEIFKQRNITIDIVTKNMNLLKSEQAKEIVENVKTINFLIKTSEDIEKVHLASMIEFGKTHFNTIFTKKVNLQHVVGSTSIEDFKKIIEQSLNSRLMITLLGSVKGHEDNAFYAGNYKEWLNELKMLNIKFIKQGLFPKISIDGLLEMNYKEDFAELGINKKNDYNIKSTKLLIDGIEKKIILSFNGIINEEIKLNKDWLINYNKITKSGNKNGNKIKYK